MPSCKSKLEGDVRRLSRRLCCDGRVTINWGLLTVSRAQQSQQRTSNWTQQRAATGSKAAGQQGSREAGKQGSRLAGWQGGRVAGWQGGRVAARKVAAASEAQRASRSPRGTLAAVAQGALSRGRVANIAPLALVPLAAIRHLGAAPGKRPHRARKAPALGVGMYALRRVHRALHTIGPSSRPSRPTLAPLCAAGSERAAGCRLAGLRGCWRRDDSDENDLGIGGQHFHRRREGRRSRRLARSWLAEVDSDCRHSRSWQPMERVL